MSSNSSLLNLETLLCHFDWLIIKYEIYRRKIRFSHILCQILKKCSKYAIICNIFFFHKFYILWHTTQNDTKPIFNISGHLWISKISKINPTNFFSTLYFQTLKKLLCPRKPLPLHLDLSKKWQALYYYCNLFWGLGFKRHYFVLIYILKRWKWWFNQAHALRLYCTVSTNERTRFTK